MADIRVGARIAGAIRTDGQIVGKVCRPAGMQEDLDTPLTEQEALIEELNAILDEKANNNAIIRPLEVTENGTYYANGVDGYAPVIVNVPSIGNIGGLTKYAKIIAKPESAASFDIENPLGGIAKKVCVQAISELTASVDIRKYLADYALGIGLMELASSDTTIRYAVYKVEDTPDNQQFAMSDGVIKLHRYNSSNDWGVDTEYEVEIWQ